MEKAGKMRIGLWAARMWKEHVAQGVGGPEGRLGLEARGHGSELEGEVRGANGEGAEVEHAGEKYQVQLFLPKRQPANS
ncbi:hypothetical protein L3X38_010143 [Prunus dulcis]|uniref:Uncharacterized protein n=1 Tax=Prunus dulcis TaxID=3755 RepID=A0AAD4WFU6_PRUDU|nr:hypothetical protein L3X38_010143 [Prunus dulcis]